MDEDGHAGDNGIGGDVAARIEGKHNIKPCFVLFPFAVIVVVDMDEDRATWPGTNAFEPSTAVLIRPCFYSFFF